MSYNGSVVNSPSDIALVTCLKALATQGDLCTASRVHVHILRHDLHAQNIFVGTALLSLYAKCGALARAQQIFDDLSSPNLITWNALISGYAQYGHTLKAWDCFAQLKAKGLTPDEVTYLAVLKACSSAEAAEKGVDVHNEIAEKLWLRKSTVLGSALVDMYAKCGDLAQAQNVFDELPWRNTVTWTGLISGYVHHGWARKALDCFDSMQDEGLSPNSFTLSCVLKACGVSKATERGIEIHHEIVREGLLGKDLVLATALVDMYAKCGEFGKARSVLDELPFKDVALYNALITGYCEHGHGEKALDSYYQMKDKGLSPDVVTYSCALKACGTTGLVQRGQEIHDTISKGPWEKHRVVNLALIDMYAKCGLFEKAQQIFDEVPARDPSLWNMLITRYCEFGCYEKVLDCFEQMKSEGLSADTVTFACILKACGNIGASKKGEELYLQIIDEGLLRSFSVLGSALVCMFANVGALGRAEDVLNKLPVRNVVSWTALITSYCQQGHGEEAINCFEKMKRDNCSPDIVTYACVLQACTNIGAIKKAEEIHAEIAREGFLAKAVVIGNALVDMYGKCGSLYKAQEVFDNLSYQDKVSWTALIGGYCQHGHGEEALYFFKKMIKEAVSPDAVTFACVLKACNSIGSAEKGQMYFESMNRTFGIIPVMEHHTCMVDLFGRAGHLDKAMALIERMAIPQLGMSALISTCLKRGYSGLESCTWDLDASFNIICYDNSGCKVLI